jgi:hypothetical protein
MKKLRYLSGITVDQARAVTMFNPGAWVVQQTAEGWVASKGDIPLITTNGGHTRRFPTVGAALARLHAEVGVLDVRVLYREPASQPLV